MWKIFIKDIFNILLLSHIQTTWNQLSTASFWLAVHLTADRPTMHRKFWRISSFKELWAMKRILSLHSRKELRSACFPFISFRILAFLQKCYSQNPPADWLCKSAPLSSNLLPFFYARSRTAGLQFRHSVHPRRFHFPYCSHCISRSVMGKKSSSGPTSQSSPLKYFHSGFPSV